MIMLFMMLIWLSGRDALNNQSSELIVAKADKGYARRRSDALNNQSSELIVAKAGKSYACSRKSA